MGKLQIWSTTVEILYEVQTIVNRLSPFISTTVEILYEVQTIIMFWKTPIYNSRNFIWSSNFYNNVKRKKSTTVEILYEVQTLFVVGVW